MATSKNKKELWGSINDYHFDNLVPVHLADRVKEMFGGPDHSTRAFASKLTRKLKWGTGFALRAIAEYKKYVYVGVISAKNVTPSKVIDQVWHEHQLFTKAYREFCSEVIGKDFDHTPELVPIPEQILLFNQQYLDTLALYRAEFNIEPPAGIWAVRKFDPSLLPAASSMGDGRNKSGNDKTSDCIIGADDSPLYMQVDTTEFGSSGFHGFGGGTSGGGGATDDWSSHSGHEGHGTDGGHGGGGDSSDGSSGGSSDGGSACSSSCGGGGCGGGGCGGS